MSTIHTTGTTTTTASSLASETVTRAVVDAVADAKDISPVDVSPPLYETIDPDALEQFVSDVTPAATANEVQITFAYAGYEVTVTGDGDVDLAGE